MTADMMALVFAALAGLTMAVQGAMNSALSAATGLWGATFVVHVIGLAVSTAFLLGSGQGARLLAAVRASPPVNLLGGVLGVLIVYAVVRGISKVGAGAATTAIVVGQVTTAFLLDHFGLFGLKGLPLTWWRPAGLGLLAVGAYLLLRK
jgi:transporter family-2 protein